MVRRALPTGARGESFIQKAVLEAKQGNDVVGCLLGGCLMWARLVVCDRFRFLKLEASQA